MPKHSIILSVTDEQTPKQKAIRVLFPAINHGKYRIDVVNAKQRSSSQNRYYWGLVIPMLIGGFYEKGTDATTQEVHEFLKKEFNYNEIVNPDTGEVKTFPLSTTKLTTTGFMEFISKVQRFAAEWLQVVIPDPGEQLNIDYDLALAQYDQEFNSVIVENGK